MKKKAETQANTKTQLTTELYHSKYVFEFETFLRDDVW